MNDHSFDIKAIENIFNHMVNVIDQSKNDIFIISEQSRRNYEDLQNELQIVKEDISRVITEGDTLEEMTRQSRRQLAGVSKDFLNYSEAEVKKSYETANDYLVRLSINRMEEKQLRIRRDELERRLVSIMDTIERADQLVSQVTTIITYLTSDLKNVGEALETARHTKDFSVRIIQAQEDERKRLSRDIHDGPAQMLANVLIRSGLIEKVYNEKGSEQAFCELANLKEMVRNALLEVRRIIYDLRPMALDDLGLIPTLKKYLSTIEEYERGTKIHFQTHGSEERLDSNIEVSIFRLVQEAVSNAIRHGKSKDIWVKIEWLHGIMNIIIKDNGHGFDKKEVKDKSFGLIGMRERIDLLKGEMKIVSSPGNGAVIFFKIPLEDDN